MLHITGWAYRKGRKCFGLSRTALERMAYRAFEDGLAVGQTKGALREYLAGLFFYGHEVGDELRVYGELVYIFAGPALVTVQHLPRTLRTAAVEQLREHEDRLDGLLAA